MKKQLNIKVNGKEKLYKVSTLGSSKYYCYYDIGGVFGGWSEFGQAKSLDDAITICKAHAGSGAELNQIKDL